VPDPRVVYLRSAANISRLRYDSVATAYSLAVTGAAISIAESAGTDQLGVSRKSRRRRWCRRRRQQLLVMVSILLCCSHRKQLSGNQACQQQAASCSCHRAPLQHHAALGRHSSIARLIFSSETCIWMPRKNIKRQQSAQKKLMCTFK